MPKKSKHPETSKSPLRIRGWEMKYAFLQTLLTAKTQKSFEDVCSDGLTEKTFNLINVTVVAPFNIVS